MTLFDTSPFGPGVKAIVDPDGPYRVEVWAPAGAVWIPLDRVERCEELFESFEDALETALRWLDAGRVLDPSARIVDEGGHPLWVSRCPYRTVVTNPAYL